MPDARRRRRWPLALALLLLVGGVLAWLALKPAKPELSDGAAEANARGVGHMERVEFPEAVADFERVVELAPGWLPGRVNLAISLFNQQSKDQKDLNANTVRAQGIFRDVIAADPDNKHAHYCLGMIALFVGRADDAHLHFSAVQRLDPDDSHTNLRMGQTHPDGPNSPAAAKFYERALELDPYLTEARYRLSRCEPFDPAREELLRTEHVKLLQADRFTESRIVYGEMGKYGDVIGRVPGRDAVSQLPAFEAVEGLKVILAPGARWAADADLDPGSRNAARARFGGTAALFDADGDGRPDVFLASAVVEDGRVRDLLLHNDGGDSFTDATAAAGLAGGASWSASAGDFDNDGKPDLATAGPSGVRLLRNAGGRFADVSGDAGFAALQGRYLGLVWLDIDQDGDLDLALCQFADAPGPFDGPRPGGRVRLMENVGVAPAVAPDAPPAGLTVAFRWGEAFDAAAPAQSVACAVATDVDADKDIDLVALPEGGTPVVVQSDRLMRFTRVAPKWATESGRWNGGLVLDANHDARSDLFLIRDGAPPLFLASQGKTDFVAKPTDSPPLRQAVTADLDFDGWPDVVGLGAGGTPVALHNRAGELAVAAGALASAKPGRALAVADLTGDGLLDVLVWGDGGLRLYRNAGTGNKGVLVEPTGFRDKGSNRRTPADGFGTWVMAQAGAHWAGAERATVSAGLGQSLLPTPLGLGRRDRADVLRLRWPDSVIQAELEVPAGPYQVVETNRKGTSCPVLLAWDGTRFGFVTDFLGVAALGECGPDGATRKPRLGESVKIEPGQLAARDGHYEVKIAEPMDELLYLDHLRLDAIDHPAGAAVYPDERFVFDGPRPTEKLLAFPTRHAPSRAADDAGRDLTEVVHARDGRAADAFARRSWLGYAADHALTLDFPDVPPGRWHLVLAGWTDYPYPESIYAATRARIELKPPVLERETAPGVWAKVCDLGFPAGLPRVMTRELPGDFRGGRVRVATNMQVHWDRIELAEARDVSDLGRVTELPVASARLAARGFIREVAAPGGAVSYDDSRTEPVAVTAWAGKLTRLGDVTELLQAADDRLVLCGPGDEITVRFDAKSLPPPPAGWVRSFVLRARGYCKDASVTTRTGGATEPLPFAAMPNYPDFGGVTPPATDAAQWQTRPAGR